MKTGQYVILDLRNRDFMKDENDEICVYSTEQEACENCGMYELENVWVCELKFNHIEPIE